MLRPSALRGLVRVIVILSLINEVISSNSEGINNSTGATGYTEVGQLNLTTTEPYGEYDQSSANETSTSDNSTSEYIRPSTNESLTENFMTQLSTESSSDNQVTDMDVTANNLEETTLVYIESENISEKNTSCNAMDSSSKSNVDKVNETTKKSLVGGVLGYLTPDLEELRDALNPSIIDHKPESSTAAANEEVSARFGGYGGWGGGQGQVGAGQGSSNGLLVESEEGWLTSEVLARDFLLAYQDHPGHHVSQGIKK